MDSIKALIEKIAKVLESRDEILFACLFGSTARGESKENSDIDIGIFLKREFKPGAFYCVEIAQEIEKETGLKNVEVVILNGKNLRFLNQVLRYGKIIFSKDEKARIAFEKA